jgi:hypothetical protein
MSWSPVRRFVFARANGDPVMKFARIVFVGAGIWGIVVLTPFYWLIDITGRRHGPPTDYPQVFYGFMSVALAWQIAFLVIGSDPARFRPLMIPSILEKLGWVLTLALLYGHGGSRRPTFSRWCLICCWASSSSWRL